MTTVNKLLGDIKFLYLKSTDVEFSEIIEEALAALPRGRKSSLQLLDEVWLKIEELFPSKGDIDLHDLAYMYRASVGLDITDHVQAICGAILHWLLEQDPEIVAEWNHRHDMQDQMEGLA